MSNPPGFTISTEEDRQRPVPPEAAERWPWLAPYLRLAIDALGLTVWTIRIAWAPEVRIDDSDATYEGSCETRWNYRYAVLLMEEACLDKHPPHARRMILHELLHVRYAEIEEGHTQVVNLMVRQADRANALNALGRWEEHSVGEMTAGLAPFLERAFQAAQLATDLTE